MLETGTVGKDLRTPGSEREAREQVFHCYVISARVSERFRAESRTLWKGLGSRGTGSEA